MGTEEVPSIAYVLLTLLKRYLISNGAGLISHRVLMELDMEFLGWSGSCGSDGFLMYNRVKRRWSKSIHHT